VRILRTVSPLNRVFTPPSVDELLLPPFQCIHLPTHIHKRIFISSSPFPVRKLLCDGSIVVTEQAHCCTSV
jgi:hypothetical protein